MSTLNFIYQGLRQRGRRHKTMSNDNDNDTTTSNDGPATSNGNAAKAGFWESYDFSALNDDELSAMTDASIKIQSMTRMFIAKKQVAGMPKLIHEWKVVSKDELIGELSFGKSIRIKVEPYFPLVGEKVTGVMDGQIYVLMEEFGSRAALHAAEKETARKVKKTAAKRKIGAESSSINQMKDAKVRSKASSMLKQVKQFQAMTSYGSPELAEACPASDSILIIRDEIAHQPDTKPQGLQARKDAHFALLVPDKFVGSSEKKKELGKYLCEVGKHLQNTNSSATKRKVTCTNNESRFLECVYGKPRTKKARTDDV